MHRSHLFLRKFTSFCYHLKGTSFYGTLRVGNQGGEESVGLTEDEMPLHTHSVQANSEWVVLYFILGIQPIFVLIYISVIYIFISSPATLATPSPSVIIARSSGGFVFSPYSDDGCTYESRSSSYDISEYHLQHSFPLLISIFCNVYITPFRMNPSMVAPAGGGLPHTNISPLSAINYLICTDDIVCNQR